MRSLRRPSTPQEVEAASVVFPFSLTVTALVSVKRGSVLTLPCAAASDAPPPNFLLVRSAEILRGDTFVGGRCQDTALSPVFEEIWSLGECCLSSVPLSRSCLPSDRFFRGLLAGRKFLKVSPKELKGYGGSVHRRIELVLPVERISIKHSSS